MRGRELPAGEPPSLALRCPGGALLAPSHGEEPALIDAGNRHVSAPRAGELGRPTRRYQFERNRALTQF